jgi:hypothetical protein
LVGWFLHLGIRAKIGVIAGIIAAIAAISVSGYLIYKRNISASTESSPVTVTLNISNAKPANAAIQESDALSTFGIYTSANATIKYVTIRGINPTFTIPISAKC